MVAGRDAAEALVKKEFEAEAQRILGSANLTQEAIDHFTEKLAKMAEMCGESSEAQTVAKDEASIMHSGNMTVEEARVAKDLADYVEGICQSGVLDLDFFVGRLADESPECSALVAESQLLQMHKHLSMLRVPLFCMMRRTTWATTLRNGSTGTRGKKLCRWSLY